jgi:hypothetical protein
LPLLEQHSHNLKHDKVEYAKQNQFFGSLVHFYSNNCLSNLAELLLTFDQVNFLQLLSLKYFKTNQKLFGINFFIFYSISFISVSSPSFLSLSHYEGKLTTEPQLKSSENGRKMSKTNVEQTSAAKQM